MTGETRTATEREMPLAELLATVLPGSCDSWDEQEAAIRRCLCLCCGRPGHYQEMLEAHVAVHGLDGLAVCIEGERLDGNHRVIAARRLGIDTIPIETREEAGERWLRAHGPVGWLGRKSGDISPEEMAWLTFDVLHRFAPWPTRSRTTGHRDLAFAGSKSDVFGRTDAEATS